jgi:hypothetical protein
MPKINISLPEDIIKKGKYESEKLLGKNKFSTFIAYLIRNHKSKKHE